MKQLRIYLPLVLLALIMPIESGCDRPHFDFAADQMQVGESLVDLDAQLIVNSIGEITSIGFYRHPEAKYQPDIDDSVIELIASVDTLTDLYLGPVDHVTDEALIRVWPRLPLLRSVILPTTSSDRCLPGIPPSIERVDMICNKQVSDRGLENCQWLKNVRSLDLLDTSVDGTFLGSISENRITWLRLAETQLSDDTIAFLNRLRHLEFLDISRTDVTEDGIASLKLPNLKELHLYKVPISGEKLQIFDGLPSLRVVEVSQSDTLAHANVRDARILVR